MKYSLFAAEYGPDQAALRHQDLAYAQARIPNCRTLVFDLEGGRSLNLLFGSDVAQFDNSEFFCLAIGTRRLSKESRHLLESRERLDDFLDLVRQGLPDILSLFLVDKRCRQVLVATDHVSLNKIFCRSLQGVRFYSSQLAYFNPEELKPSFAGVASYVICEHSFSETTLYDGVECLQQAQIYTFSGDEKPLQETYWRYRAALDVPADWDYKAHQASFWRRLLAAVEAETKDRDVAVSISGGFEASALLGILRFHLGRKEVPCFCYAHGTPQRGSDGYVSAKIAEACGSPIWIKESYDGNFLDMLLENLRVGQLRRNPLEEIQSYRALIREDILSPDHLFLFGDESFGSTRARFRHELDPLSGSPMVRDPKCLKTFADYLEPGAQEAIEEALWPLFRSYIARFDEIEDPTLKAHHIRYNESVANVTLPIRSDCNVSYYDASVPFLRRDVLDAMAGVPVSGLPERRFYKETVERFLPEIFSIPRAWEDQSRPDIGKELARHAAELQDLVRKNDLGIEGIISPDGLSHLLADHAATTQGEGGAGPGAGRSLKTVARSVIKETATRSRFVRNQIPNIKIRFMPPTADKSPSRAHMIFRLLYMAMAMKSAQLLGQ